MNTSPATPDDLEALRAWTGRSEARVDTITAAPQAAMIATLDRDDPPPQAGTPVPPLWHWLYFTPVTRASEIGPDGHAKRGGFLPPVPLPRRMWAGGRLAFNDPLRVGDVAARTSRIADVTVKSGRSGSLVFVSVHHIVTTGRGTALTEEHDIVYREPPQPGAPTPPPQAAPEGADFSREIAPDPVLLFRYSALTFNGHRIHYDRSYVTEVEGYPGLIVHGPLIATLLVDLLRRNVPDARLSTFSFRAVRPLFDIHRFTVCGRAEPGDAGGAARNGAGGDERSGRRFSLWARDHEGWLAMQATAEVS